MFKTQPPEGMFRKDQYLAADRDDIIRQYERKKYGVEGRSSRSRSRSKSRDKRSKSRDKTPKSSLGKVKSKIFTGTIPNLRNQTNKEFHEDI
jgi:hypothetical protein